jgi:hypothetical protein
LVELIAILSTLTELKRPLYLRFAESLSAKPFEELCGKGTRSFCNDFREVKSPGYYIHSR